MRFIKNLFTRKKNPPGGELILSSSDISFEAHKNNIYPYFKQMGASDGPSQPFPSDLRQLDSNVAYDVPFQIVFRNICEDLNCLYGVDKGYGYEIITDDHLKCWGINQEELHKIALDNFRALIATNLTARSDTNGIMFTINGNLEAGLVLIDEIWEKLEAEMGEQVVISVPARDVIVATGKSNNTMINSFTENSKIILTTGDHPLSKNWFIREAGQWKLLKAILP